ncbi:hypothetical protein BDIM_09060 [Brevundimonas diminuta ATCC 11568]|nr:hypothetical protein BDIM_09060 [Brevundimonas diminuta ATCC 11568]
MRLRSASDHQPNRRAKKPFFCGAGASTGLTGSAAGLGAVA